MSLVSLNVPINDPEHLAKACEMLGRVAAGLALEGIAVSLNLNHLEVEEEAEAEPGD